MFSLLKIFGIGKEEVKNKVWVAGEKSKGVCSHCSKVVTTTWKDKDVIHAGMESKVFASVCDICQNIVHCADEEVQKALDEMDLAHSQETFSSVRGTPEVIIPELDIEESSVVIDNDIEARNALLEAFPQDILNDVGNGDVVVVNSETLDVQKNISSLLSGNSESFKNMLRSKEKVGSKVWVNWFKHEDGVTIPCNEILTLTNDWSSTEVNEASVHEIEEKLIELSGTNKIAILMIQKMKK